MAEPNDDVVAANLEFLSSVVSKSEPMPAASVPPPPPCASLPTIVPATTAQSQPQSPTPAHPVARPPSSAAVFQQQLARQNLFGVSTQRLGTLNTPVFAPLLKRHASGGVIPPVRSPPPRSVSPSMGFSYPASLGFAQPVAMQPTSSQPVSASLPAAAPPAPPPPVPESPAPTPAASTARRGQTWSSNAGSQSQQKGEAVSTKALLQRMRDAAVKAGIRCSVSESAAVVLSLGLQDRIKTVFEELARACSQRCDSRIETMCGLPQTVDSAALTSAVQSQGTWEISSDPRAKIDETKRLLEEQKTRRESGAPASAVFSSSASFGQQDVAPEAVAAKSRSQAANAAAMMALGGRPQSGRSTPHSVSPSLSSGTRTGSTPVWPPKHNGNGERRITARDVARCHRVVGFHVIQKLSIKRNRRAARLGSQNQ